MVHVEVFFTQENHISLIGLAVAICTSHAMDVQPAAVTQNIKEDNCNLLKYEIQLLIIIE